MHGNFTGMWGEFIIHSFIIIFFLKVIWKESLKTSAVQQVLEMSPDAFIIYLMM